MPVIGGDKHRDKVPVESETMRQAEIGIAVERELQRYRATIREIDTSSEQRKLAAQRMFADRIEAIVQRVSPLVNGEQFPVTQEGELPE